jgi:hypothetical protein
MVCRSTISSPFLSPYKDMSDHSVSKAKSNSAKRVFLLSKMICPNEKVRQYSEMSILDKKNLLYPVDIEFRQPVFLNWEITSSNIQVSIFLRSFTFLCMLITKHTA